LLAFVVLQEIVYQSLVHLLSAQEYSWQRPWGLEEFCGLL
jgi:hypothetical protein